MYLYNSAGSSSVRGVIEQIQPSCPRDLSTQLHATKMLLLLYRVQRTPRLGRCLQFNTDVRYITWLVTTALNVVLTGPVSKRCRIYPECMSYRTYASSGAAGEVFFRFRSVTRWHTQ